MKSILKEINNDLKKLEEILLQDSRFTYSIIEGGFYTQGGIVVGISRSPYQGCLYATSKKGELDIDELANYIIKLFKEKSK